MDSINVGVIDAAGVSGGTLSVGSTVMVGVRTHTKTSLGNATVTGDFGMASVWYGYVEDSDLIDAPLWAQIRNG